MKRFHWGDVVAEVTSKYGELVVGIDPVYENIPNCFKDLRKDSIGISNSFSAYIRLILETVKDRVGFVKFQSAFFEAIGSSGIRLLADAIYMAKSYGLMVILDAKRGDISSTSAAYAKAYLTPIEAGSYSDLEVDCITINPFLGADSVEPFLHCARTFGKGIFFLVKTSNPSAGWIQDSIAENNGEKQPISDRIARQVAEWSESCLGSQGLSSIGAVVGATFSSDAARLRAIMPNSIFLMPGIGAILFLICRSLAAVGHLELMQKPW